MDSIGASRHVPLLTARKTTRRLRKVPGTWPIVERLRRYASRPVTLTVEDFDGDLSMSLSLNEHMTSQIFWHGYYAQSVRRMLDRFLCPGDVFFDVGANVGEVTLLAAKRVGIGGRVYSFEPMPALFSALEANVRLNKFTNVHAVRKGMASEDSEQAMYMLEGDYADGTEHRGLGTLYRSDDRAAPVGSVTVTTLDTFARGVDLRRLNGMKLDIEGAELPALQGGLGSIERFRPWMIIEIGVETCRAAGYEPGAILELLDPFGYRFFSIGRRGALNPLRNLGPWQDVLCLPPGGAS